ncbi:glycosyltransferase [Streptomyces anulatus]|uniref:glycosyltransferase n=1 Tax=Streptomyces anulatus TaxID=1892 RepID=UPI0038657B4C
MVSYGRTPLRREDITRPRVTSATIPGEVGLQKATPWSTWHPSGIERPPRRKATRPVWDTGFAATNDDEFTDDAMAIRLDTLRATGVGWCAGWSEDLHPDGTTTPWRCPTPAGRHEAGDVWTHWPTPNDTIPLGPTTILARTELARAAPMGGLVQGEDYCSLAVTCLAPGILLPVPVYRYRKHPGQMTAQRGYDQLETAARTHAWQYGHALQSALRSGSEPPRPDHAGPVGGPAR